MINITKYTQQTKTLTINLTLPIIKLGKWVEDHN